MDKKDGAFFIHGFSGHKDDFNELTTLVLNEGIDVFSLSIPGHSEEEKIDDYTYLDWIETAKKEYLKFKSEHNKVYLVGFSMGGAIATYLASNICADKLILLAPAFEYISAAQNLEDAADYSLKYLKRVFKSKAKSENDLEDAELRTRLTSHNKKKITLKSCRNFILLTSFIRKNTSLIDIPVRIYHGDKDEVIPISGSFKAFYRFVNPNKTLVVVKNARHLLMASKQYPLICNEIVEFIKNDIISYNQERSSKEE